MTYNAVLRPDRFSGQHTLPQDIHNIAPHLHTFSSDLNQIIYEVIFRFCDYEKKNTRGLSGYRARRRVADSRGPVLVAGLSLNK
jgi:hypothetical protein